MPKNTRFVVRVGKLYVDKQPTKQAKLVDSVEKARLYRTESGAEKLASTFFDDSPEATKHYVKPQVHPVNLKIQASGYVDPDP